MSGTPALDSGSGVQNATNGTRDVELEFEGGQEAKIREISMDNNDPQVAIYKSTCLPSCYTHCIYGCYIMFESVSVLSAI